jgi:hypothetical protein
MGAYEDYLNSLEGKEDLVLDDVIKELTNKHNEDVGTWGAKVETLTGTVAEKDGSIASITSELTAQKAKNLDLYMQLPGDNGEPKEPDEKGEVTLENVTIDDLFSKG